MVFAHSSSEVTTFRSMNKGGVAVVSPRIPAILSWSSPPGGTAILSEHDLDWLQSGVVYPPTAVSLKGRSMVTRRQAKRHERWPARKYGIGTSPPRCQRATTHPRKFSSVSGQLRQVRSDELRSARLECLRPYHQRSPRW